jgi:hypothetical protein
MLGKRTGREELATPGESLANITGPKLEQHWGIALEQSSEQH